MAINEQEYRELKRKAEAARQARDRASGQLDATMERLAGEFECNTVEKAEKLATRLKKDAAKAEATYDAAVVTFEEAWDDQLED